MYCGRLSFTDANVNSLGLSPVPRRQLSLWNSLVENVALGPTMVINARGRGLITKGLHDYAVMHDAWSYVVFSALGTIVYDIEPLSVPHSRSQPHRGAAGTVGPFVQGSAL